MRDLITKSLKGKEFLGHPSGLFVLFFTEMWERFSYYGMRALLVLYMTKYLLLEPSRAADVLGYTSFEAVLKSVFGELNIQQVSSQIYGLYTGFVYFTPFFGGILADKVFGQYKSVYIGGILMAIGHFLLASEQMFLVALVFIMLGNGFFKPNISTQVGNLYAEGDPRRDSAFTIFYMGINLGGFFSPLVCGTLGQVWGWHYGFGAAGVGMILGLIVYWLGAGLLPPDSRVESTSVEEKPLTKAEWNSVIALMILCFLNIVFWGIFEQQGNTLQLWADDRTNWEFMGMNIPSTWYQSFNPAFIFIFAPVLAAFWGWQFRRTGKNSSSVTKMGIGCLLCGIAYLVMVAGARVVPEGERGSVMWLTMTTWLFTMGELYLSPIGLSLVTKIAPRKILSMMMGMWFLSSFFGNYMSGYIGMFYSKMSGEDFFLLCTALGVGTGIIFFIVRGPVIKAIGKEA